MGMELANEKMRARIARIMTEAQDSDCCSDELKALFKEWIEKNHVQLITYYDLY